MTLSSQPGSAEKAIRKLDIAQVRMLMLEKNIYLKKTHQNPQRVSEWIVRVWGADCIQSVNPQAMARQGQTSKSLLKYALCTGNGPLQANPYCSLS
jgi:hypothetical protein